MVSILVFLVLLPLSLILTGLQHPSSQHGIGDHFLNALHNISRVQNQIEKFSERCLLFLSLLCCLVAMILLPHFIESLTAQSYSIIPMPQLIKDDGSSIILLGLLLILHATGEICLAKGERGYQNRYAVLCLNSFFWLPLLFAWSSLAYYLRLGDNHSTSAAVSTVWLVLLQPLGSLALILALLGPYFMVNTTLTSNKKQVYYWIRELRMLISLLIITMTVVGSRTCFSPAEIQNTPGEIIQFLTLPVVFLILLLLVKRFHVHFEKWGWLFMPSFWKSTLWLALIALTASFLAFHVLGMSDPWMHVLLNFSLLAIWSGLIAPKFHIPPATSLRKHS
ncbi:hypothetical protein [Gimesia aquarii]|uniref:Uncharacterized protein n=1 Tax=Gimesia aquarii TaxID=2527964 RepID=A0A517W2X5_9PLAN|nr:hypothetical protein [Gimesia aquarii]QDT99580.1 hypothetical protein V144x_50920 [Gimesia aquarii]